MLIRWLLAALHLVALGVGFAAIWTRARALAHVPDAAAYRRVFAADAAWGLAALLWIGTGLLRAFGGYEKGAAYCLQNHVFWAKMALLGAVLLLGGCGPRPAASGQTIAEAPATPAGPYLVVLGTGQDGGYPQAGTPPGEAWASERRRYAASLALVDPATGQRWLFEATPDFREQLHALDRLAPAPGVPGLAGIFLTHAHVGHYAGLIHLGREIIGARGVAVHAMPRMRAFLAGHGPWDQLVRLGNVELREMAEGVPVRLNARLSITPFRVPHRDEYSETVGFRIAGPSRTVVFLPDIDKWERWQALGTRIEDVVAAADVAYLDGTFYRDGEVPGRAMAEIPHPFMEETMRRFAAAPAAERAKIRFIHLNRTNPAAFADSDERRAVERAGFGVATRLEILPL